MASDYWYAAFPKWAMHSVKDKYDDEDEVKKVQDTLPYWEIIGLKPFATYAEAKAYALAQVATSVKVNGTKITCDEWIVRSLQATDDETVGNYQLDRLMEASTKVGTYDTKGSLLHD